MAASAAKPTGLGFVELDAHAMRVVGAAARRRASYSRAPGEPTIIPLFSNHGFLPFLRNLICSMRRLRVNNWLVIAMDNATCPALMGAPGNGEQSACVYPYSRAKTGVTTSNDVATYRSVNFNRMVMQRPLWVRWLLSRGYSVIQCDLDIVWLRDPQPLLRSIRVPHMLFQSEQAYGLNGGFYFARPGNATLTFFDDWLERLQLMISNPNFEEQHALNSVIRRATSYPAESRLRYAILDDVQFPNGKIWWSYPWRADKRVAYIVHANWNKQQKKSRLARDALWFLTRADSQCDTDVDPMAHGCNKLCHPVAYAAPGGNASFKTCTDLNRDDDFQARKHGGRWASSKFVWKEGQPPRGTFWHPTAYDQLPNCKRDLSKQSYAEAIHERLLAIEWGKEHNKEALRAKSTEQR